MVSWVHVVLLPVLLPNFLHAGSITTLGVLTLMSCLRCLVRNNNISQTDKRMLK